MIKVIKAVSLTLLFFMGITFAMENTQSLVLRYFGYETPPINLYLLILVSILFGVIVAGIGFIIDQWSLKKVVRQKEREIESLEKEVRTVQETGRDLVNSREDG